jgi:PAS domain S-box-containing protein
MDIAERCLCGKNHTLAEQAEQSRKIVKAIFDSTYSFIILIAPDFSIMFFNSKAQQYSKLLYGRELVIGDSILTYKRKEDEKIFKLFRKNFSRAIKSKIPVIGEREMHFDKTSLWIRSEFTAVYDDGKIIGVALRLVDVSERRKKELLIEKQNEQLRQIGWIQSHETRQPIATILGLIHILDKTSLTEDNLQIIGMLEATIEKLDLVVRKTVLKANGMC